MQGVARNVDPVSRLFHVKPTTEDAEDRSSFQEMIRGGRGSVKRRTASYTGKLAEAEKRDRERQLRQRYAVILPEEAKKEQERG